MQSKTSNSFNLECKDSAGCEEMALTKELCSAIPDLKSTCPIKCGIKTCDNNQGKEDFWKSKFHFQSTLKDSSWHIFDLYIFLVVQNVGQIPNNVGVFGNTKNGVSGSVSVIDEKTLLLNDFTFDGREFVFWLRIFGRFIVIHYCVIWYCY